MCPIMGTPVFGYCSYGYRDGTNFYIVSINAVKIHVSWTKIPIKVMVACRGGGLSCQVSQEMQSFHLLI